MSNIFHKIGDWWEWHAQTFGLALAFLTGLGVYLFSYTIPNPEGFLVSMFGLGIMIYPIFVLLTGVFVRRHIARIRASQEAAE